MPMRKPGEDVGRGRRHHDLEEELELVEPQHRRDVAVVLRDVADADRGVDDDRPDRRDEDHEDRRRLAVAERRERERQPGERRHGAQHLEDRIEPAHRPGRLADQRAERDAGDRRRAHSRSATRCRLADRCQNRPLSMPPRSKNGSTISSQVSLSTRDGGGSVAPALRHSSSQTSRMSAITTSGGTTRAATADARARSARRRAACASACRAAAPWLARLPAARSRFRSCRRHVHFGLAPVGINGGRRTEPVPPAARSFSRPRRA